MDLFSADKIVKKFSNHVALDKVTLHIPQGCIYGLLGPNGAGKTTMLRIINRITMPDEGELYFSGRSLQPDDVMQIGYLPEERGLYKKMKVGEQSLYLARLKGLDKEEATRRLVHWFKKLEMQAWWNKKVEELSKGMQQKIQFVASVIHNPKLLIFDEPFSGFDPINTNILKQEILELKKNGATIIFSTHDMGSVEELCDHITLINKAKTILEGEINEIRSRYKSNVYEIGYRGEPLEMSDDKQERFHVLQRYESGRNRYMKIKAAPGLTGNDLIRELLQQIEIISFHEVIPRMNEIFIHVVESQNKSK